MPISTKKQRIIMKKNITISIVIFCVVSAMSCVTEKNLAWVEKPIEFVAAETSFCDTTFLSNMRLVRLENSGTQGVVNQISKIIEIDDRLYIFDRILNQITVFDNDGRFVRTINHMGHGNGEYIRLTDVTYDRTKRELLCLAEPSSIIHYALDGTYIETDKLDDFYTDICCDESHIYLYHSTYADAKTPDYTISSRNKRDGSMKELLAFTEEHAPFCSLGSKMFANGGSIEFVRKFDNDIYHVSNGSIDSCFSMNMKSFTFPMNRLSKQYDCGELYDLCKKEKLIYMITNLVQGKSLFMFSSNLYDIHVAQLTSGLCRNYSYMTVSKYNIPVSLFCPVEGGKNKCCFVLQASSVMNFKRMYEADQRVRNSIRAEFINDTKDISEDSNPVLLIFDVK